MLTHYLKIATRQLLKYKVQTAISIISLAIGFTCFALATLWMRYETSYDVFHKNVDRTYCLLRNPQVGFNRLEKTTSEISSKYLLENCPEVEAAASFTYSFHSMSTNNITYDRIQELICDSNFLQLFNIHIIKGNNSFLFNDNEIAITEELAKRMWGNKNPIGKTMKSLKDNKKRTVTAVVKGWSKHSNFPFDFLSKKPHDIDAHNIWWFTVFRISPQTNKEAFIGKLDTLNITTVTSKKNPSVHHDKLTAVLLPQLRHVCPNIRNDVQINHIYLFALSGGLLILCAVLNYLTLFINHIFIRKREIALRTVYGSSNQNTLRLLLTEYLLLLATALLIGMLILEIVLPYFRQMAELPDNMVSIYIETFFYSASVVLVASLLSLSPILYFRKQSLQTSIQGKSASMSYSLFRRISTGVQVAVSILFIFCTIVLMKQMDTLRHTDMGFQRENTASVLFWEKDNMPALENFLRQQPEITDLMIVSSPVFPVNMIAINKFEKEKNPTLNEEHIQCRSLGESEEYYKFYGINLLKGEWLHAGSDIQHVMLNETAARKFGLHDPIGKQIILNAGPGNNISYIVVGVIKDFQNISPTSPAYPYIFTRPNKDKTYDRYIIFKYLPRSWNSCQKKITNFLEKENHEGSQNYILFNTEEEYEKMLHSEKAMQTLLGIVSSVCILIALFGVYSMIILTCEQRRKEIAIRKVNGATVKNILEQFFREYMVLLLGASAVAFPIGYLCMKPWLENYIVQTKISWWLYVAIFIGITTLVLLCIGWRVWRTANSNPSDEIRKE